MKNNVQLSWQVAKEDNLQRYEIERSNDGISPNKVGSLCLQRLLFDLIVVLGTGRDRHRYELFAYKKSLCMSAKAFIRFNCCTRSGNRTRTPVEGTGF